MVAAAGGMPPLNVVIRISTSGAKAAASSMKQVTSASKGMSKGLGSGVIGVRTLGDSMRMTASLIKYSVAGAFMNIGKQAIQMSRQFEVSFSRIKGLVVVTGNTIDEMKSKVLSLAGETTRAPLELADALYFITSAGIKDSVIALEVLESAARAAAAGLGTTQTTADAITSTMNAYGASQMSAARAGDVLVATVREGKAEADTFAPALGKVLPIAAAYGASFEDVSAAIAALSRGGLSAGTAAIYVRQTLSQLMKPSKQATEVLKGVGLSAESIREKVQNEGLFPALVELRDKIGGIENAGDFTKVFGNVRALTSVMSLVGPAADENAEIFERLANSAGDLDFAFEQYADTIDADFNRRTAEAQQALITVGDALKPLVSMVLKASAGLAKGFSKIFGNSVGAAILKVVAGITVLVAVMAGILKTMSAYVRLGGNMTMMLTGQNLQYNALNGELTKYTIVQGTAATATAAATPPTVVQTVATGFLAKATMVAAGAMTALVRAMGPLMILLTTAMILFPLIKGLFSRVFGDGQDKKINKTSEALGNVNEALNEAAKYAATGISFSVNVDMKTEKDKITFDKLREDLEAESPGFIQMVKDMGKENGMAYVNALVQTKFGGNTEQFKTSFLEFFAEELRAVGIELQPTVFRTGIAAVDAAMEAALISAQGRIIKRKTLALSKMDIDAPTAEIALELAQMDPGNSNSTREGSENAKAYGEAFTDGIQETGSFAPLIESANVLVSELTDPTLRSRLITGLIQGGLEGLDDKLDVTGEKGGNLAKIFSEMDDVEGISNLIKGTFEVSDAAEVNGLLTEIRTAMTGVGHEAGDSALAFEKFFEVYNKHKEKVKEQVVVNKDLNSSLTAIEDRFTQGLSPAVQGAADSFKAATDAIAQFKRGQEALMGLTRTGTEAQIDYRDALRGFAEDAGEAGGNLFGTTEGADEAKSSLLDAIDGVLAVANNFAASGDVAKATAAVGEGMAQIMSAGVASGLKPEDIQKFFDDMNFNENIVQTFAGAGDNLDDETTKIGEQLVAGMAKGIDNGKSFVNRAIGNLSEQVIADLKAALLISSPSKLVADKVGKPTAQGFAMGFQKEMAGNSGKSIQKSLREAVNKAYKDGGRKSANSFFEKFLEKKGKVEDPAGDFVQETFGRMRDIVGALGDYIKSQLDFRRAKADLAKLINMQRGLDDRRKKAARSSQYASTRFGGDGGAQVTGYEQSNIDELQMDFEKTSRDYAMGRASYAALVDAEIALFEARAAASEVNDEVLSAQNAFVDASVNAENQALDLASATVGVMSAFQGQQQAAAELYTFHTELGKVYGDLAEATGIASGKLVIGKTDLFNLGEEAGKLGGFVSTVGDFTSTLGGHVITTKDAFDKDFFGDAGVFSNIVKASGNVKTLTKGIGADFIDLSRGLLDPESEMYQNLAALGPSIFKAIQTSAQNKLDQSPLNLNIRLGATVNGKTGNGKIELDFDLDGQLGDETATDTAGRFATPGFYAAKGGGSTDLISQANRYVPQIVPVPVVKKLTPQPSVNPNTTKGKAEGGPVAGMRPYMVGELGPEMFVPKVSGTIVTSSALDRYTRTRQIKTADSSQGAANNIVVTVNNPTPQAAEESITRRMKVLSNSGLFG